MELTLVLSTDVDAYEATLGQYIESNIAETREDRLLAQKAAETATNSACMATDSTGRAQDAEQASHTAATRSDESAKAASASAQQAAHSAQTAQASSIKAVSAASMARTSQVSADVSATNAGNSANAAAVSEQNAAATLASALRKENNLSDVADKAAARANLDVPSRAGDTLTGTLYSNGNKYDVGTYRVSANIGGAFVKWSADRTFAMQIDAPHANAAYGVWRVSRLGEGGRHLAGLDVYEGGGEATEPTVVLHLDAQNNAWTFSRTNISRGAGGTVWGTWNFDPQSLVAKAGDTMTGMLACPMVKLNSGLVGDGSASLLYNDAGQRNFVVRTGPSNAYQYTVVDAWGNLNVPARVTAGGGGAASASSFGYLNNEGAGHIDYTITLDVGLYAPNSSAMATQFWTTSDVRLKRDVTPISEDYAIRFVQTVNGYSFHKGKSDVLQRGFLAQEVGAAASKNGVEMLNVTPDEDPDLVEMTDRDGFVSPAGAALTIDYTQITAVHAVVLQNLLRRMSELEAKLVQVPSEPGDAGA